MKSLVILISGRGSNMLNIARACAEQQWPARVSAVISNEPEAAGLAAARDMGLAIEVVEHRGYATREAFDSALAGRVEAHAPDLVVLAGFMRVLGPGFVDRFAGRLINIHPSLLPSFPGLRTHARALDAGVRVHGATVHFVTPELDAGPIIAQAVVPVRSDDDEASLATRVQASEHVLYPAVVAGIVRDQVSLEGARVRLSPQMRAAFGVSDIVYAD